MINKGLLIVLLLWSSLHSYAQTNSPSPSVDLPDVLQGKDGKKITDKEVWQKQRRPEIRSLFEENVYGDMPKEFGSIHFKPTSEEKMAMNGKARLKQIAIDVTRNNQSLTIHLVLFIPVNATKPPPVFLLINHREADNIDLDRIVKKEFWPAEDVIERGYAIAAFQVSDVAPDSKETYGQGVLRLYPEQIEKPAGLKAIGAWAWGASRVMDYLVTDRDIDSSKVAVVGHSRGGKAALWCGAEDERFAITIANNSGCTGAALSRRRVGETISAINRSFPYWFCTNYNKFSSKEETLPIDQHMLIALMAPRAVYIASASEDAWADPVGEFLSLKYAEPVFSLFHLSPLPITQQPPVQTPVKSSNLGYHLRKGGHGLYLYDWERFMDFADAYYGSLAK